MADRFYKDIEIPDLAAGVTLEPPPVGHIQVYGRDKQLAWTDSDGVERIAGRGSGNQNLYSVRFFIDGPNSNLPVGGVPPSTAFLLATLTIPSDKTRAVAIKAQLRFAYFSRNLSPAVFLYEDSFISIDPDSRVNSETYSFVSTATHIYTNIQSGTYQTNYGELALYRSATLVDEYYLVIRRGIAPVRALYFDLEIVDGIDSLTNVSTVNSLVVFDTANFVDRPKNNPRINDILQDLPRHVSDLSFVAKSFAGDGSRLTNIQQGTPTLISGGKSFTVLPNVQVLMTEEIDLIGDLDIDGTLTEVN